MRTLKRTLVVLAAVAVVLLLVVWFGGRALLNSERGRSLAAGRLTALVGLPVQVDELSVGTGGTALAFRILEPAADGRPAGELLRVERATTDVSFTDLLTQNVNPKALTLRGAAVTLRVDRDGKLLTPAPKTSGGGGSGVPAVTVENGTLTIRQEGRPEFVFAGIGVKVMPAGDRVEISGGIRDPKWGNWEVAGEADVKGETGRLAMTTAGGSLDMALLRSVPWVPLTTWDHVNTTGTTPAKLAFEVPPGGKFRYDVELNPTGAAGVGLPDLDVVLGGVRGGVRIRDARVVLSGLTGAVADGTANVSGDLNFAPEPSVLRFDVALAKVDVKKLPAEWGLPKFLQGRMQGKADLTLRVHEDGRIERSGTGDGVVEGALGLAGVNTLALRLRGENNRYQFHAGDAPKQSSRRRDTSPPTRAVSGRVARPATIRCQSQPPKPPAKAADEPTTLDATLTLRDIDVAELLTKLEVKLPYKLGGKVSVSATVTVPVSEANLGKSYRFVGSLTSPELTFEGLRVRDAAADLAYADGVLRLKSLRGKFPVEGTADPAAGSFRGTATAAVEPRGDVSADLHLDRVPLGEVFKAVPGGGIDVKGQVTGRAEFRGPFEKLADPATWVASADLRSPDLTVYGRAVRDAVVKLKADRGTATLTDTAGQVEGIPLVIGGTLGLAKPYPFDASVKTAPARVADFRRLAPELELPFELQGKLDTDTRVRGTVQPLVYTASGTAKASELKIGNYGANTVGLKWELSKDRVKLTDVAAEVFGGSVAGGADVPFDPAKAGSFRVEFKELDAGAATKTLPDVPVRLAGRVSGTIDGTLPPATDGQPRRADAAVNLAAPKLTVQGIPTERLAGKLGFAGGALRYELQGQTLGGSFELKGRYPSKPKEPSPPVGGPPAPAAAGPKEEPGYLRVRNLDLGRVAEAFRLQSAAPLGGRADLTLEFNGDFTDGSGRVVVRDLAWGRDTLAGEIAGSFLVRDGQLETRDFGGPIAGGVLRGRARMSFADPDRNFFRIVIDRADAKRLFAPVPSLADSVQGTVAITLLGRVGSRSQGSAVVTLSRGAVFGFAVNELRVPFDWSTFNGGRGELTVRDLGTQVGAGRVTGTITYAWGATGRLTGNLRFTDVRLRSVLPGAGESSLVGNGRVTGRLDLNGTDIRSGDDVGGTLSAVLNNTSVREIPILQRATPFLSPTGLTAPFQSGELRARLARGQLRIDRLDLANPAARLHAEGAVGLDGRLDLDVVANTGQIGVNVRLLSLAGIAIPAVGPLSVTVIRDVSDLLSNRTVRLSVTGTVDNPAVRVNRAALLSDTAIRFLVGRYVLPGVTAAGTAGAAGAAAAAASDNK